MTSPPLLIPCPACSALLYDHEGHIGRHIAWHIQTVTSLRQPSQARAWLEEGFQAVREVVALEVDGDPPTEKLPPIGETVRRRPPVPAVRELDPGTPAMLRALAAAMEADGLDVEELADDVRAAGQPTSAAFCGNLNGDYSCIEPAGHSGQHYAAGVAW